MEPIMQNNIKPPSPDAVHPNPDKELLNSTALGRCVLILFPALQHSKIQNPKSNIICEGIDHRARMPAPPIKNGTGSNIRTIGTAIEQVPLSEAIVKDITANCLIHRIRCQ
jgi:hypothetical protein